MLVINFSGATGLTISNSDFDGRTKFLASCDGHHYLGFLLLGKWTELSLLGNYINHSSGQSPKVGGGKCETTVLHAANNFFDSNSGHSFDVVNGGYVLAEGKYFSKVKIPAQEASKHLFVPTSAIDCKAVIGRACSMNVLKDSGPLKGRLGDASAGGEDMENSVTQDDILTGSSSSDKSTSYSPSAGGPITPGSDTSKSMDNTEAPVSEDKTGGQADKNADDDFEESDKEGSDGSSHLRKNENDANAWQP
ncbi:unnamed protein product [Hyaloperonospora brassicae]|uniref:Pectate lyase n=1 Tax=Hyaloperonospora brassicae TaxID=162125 RepID=A0AAV0UEU5_HYABA|nr:unnamed protein product [Hyaloperonospora brassicae]